MNAVRRPRFRSALGLAAGLMLAAAVAGCATTGAGAEGETVLIVENNLLPPTSLTVRAIPDSGTRLLVGLVDPGETARLRFRAGMSGQYRFVAEAGGGQSVVSNPISVVRGDTLRWDIRSNIVTPE